MDLQSDKEILLNINFNQDGTCFALSTEKGFKIFTCSPLKEYSDRNFEGGLGRVEMLYKSNVVALLGGGKTPKYTPNKIVLWDDSQVKVITEIRLGFDVICVKLKKEKIFVVCENKIYVLKFVSLQNIYTLETYNNLKGIVAVSSDQKYNIIAYPDREKGTIKVMNTDTNTSITIKAHTGNIAFISLNSDGLLVATASEKGTLIRIFRSDTGENIQEVRRGKDFAEIYSICFSHNNQFLACSSDRGTIHIFSLDKVNEKIKDLKKKELDQGNEALTDEKTTAKNKTSLWASFIPISYFNSEWSFAQFKLSDKKPICIFNENINLIVLTYDCKLYEVSFDKNKGGDCKIEREITLNLNSSSQN